MIEGTSHLQGPSFTSLNLIGTPAYILKPKSTSSKNIPQFSI